MLISDLSKIKMLNVIERARLEEILKEQKLK
jgi:curli biogenesis system outer membrane secretion channel CsgG